MVNDYDDYYRPMMPNHPNYDYYSQPMHRPVYYEDPMYYYHPYMNAGFYPPPVHGMNQINPAYYSNPSIPPVAGGNMTAEGSNPTPTPEGIASPSVMQQFMDENGQVDIQKMLQTVGQLADTVHQVSPVIKQLNDLIRNFRA